jgi:hypothetical protein
MECCLSAGCHPGYNLNLSLDAAYGKSLGDEKVFVHVIPVNTRDRDQLANMPIDSYWQSTGTTKQKISREQNTKIFDLSADKPTATLSRDDPIWSVWKDLGDSELMILSSRPVPETSSSGEMDPRRRFIPASAAAWASHDVRIVVTAGGLRVQTRQIISPH